MDRITISSPDRAVEIIMPRVRAVTLGGEEVATEKAMASGRLVKEVKGFRATTRAEVEQALAAALDAGCGAIIDCQLDIDEMVRPMVAAGAPITDFLLKEATT